MGEGVIIRVMKLNELETRLAGAVRLTELGKSLSEVEVYAQRLIDLGLAVQDRFVKVSPEMVQGQDYDIEPGTIRINEVDLALPFDQILTIREVRREDHAISYGATLWVPVPLLSRREAVELATVSVQHLGMKPEEAALWLFMFTPDLGNEMVWRAIVDRVSHAPVATERGVWGASVE